MRFDLLSVLLMSCQQMLAFLLLRTYRYMWPIRLLLPTA